MTGTARDPQHAKPPGGPPATAFDFRAAPDDLARAIRRLGEEDAASLPLLGPADCARLCAAAEDIAFRPGQAVVGSGEAAVRQDFDVALSFPPDSVFRALAAGLEARLREALSSAPCLDDPAGFRLNDLIVQRYRRGSFGITPHRDHLGYRGLVALVTLCGAAPFFVCADRAGSGAREVPAPPGHLLLMRAPGYLPDRPRPFHFLGAVTEARLSLGLRYDSRAAAPGPSGAGVSR
ncbi:MAG: hypothetical protein QNJ30_06270 [Kiloniellales bacterium]|nr:hypothetical protein [Kiloniellales bacterium]